MTDQGQSITNRPQARLYAINDHAVHNRINRIQPGGLVQRTTRSFNDRAKRRVSRIPAAARRTSTHILGCAQDTAMAALLLRVGCPAYLERAARLKKFKLSTAAPLGAYTQAYCSLALRDLRSLANRVMPQTRKRWPRWSLRTRTAARTRVRPQRPSHWHRRESVRPSSAMLQVARSNPSRNCRRELDRLLIRRAHRVAANECGSLDVTCLTRTSWKRTAGLFPCSCSISSTTTSCTARKSRKARPCTVG